MTLHDRSDLLRLPLVDLVERPIADFRPLFRGETPPSDAELGALDRVVATRVLRCLGRESDVEALRAEADGLRRLVPHRARPELDRRSLPWSARIVAWADLVDLAAEVKGARDPEAARSLAHAREILEAVRDEPGQAQSALGDRLGLRPANLSRIVAVLEANGLLRREAVGREKRVHPVETPAAPPRQGRGTVGPEAAAAPPRRRMGWYLTLARPEAA